MTLKLLPLILLLISNSLFSQIITINDADFKNALLNTDCVDTDLDGFGEFDADTNNDGEIQITEAEAIVGLILFNQNIHSLDGIQNFINLELLICNTNNIASIDLTANTKLEHLNCGGNEFTNIDLSQMPNLEILKCHANQLINIDVSHNLNLSYFNCSGNNLSDLDTSQNLNLNWLICSDNPLFTQIDVSDNLTLESLYCVGNNLTELDLSNNSNLISLRCEDNQLTYLNIANGNNANIFRMFSFNNPNLTCIQVDDATSSFPACAYYDTFDGWCKDEISNYSNYCSLGINSFSVNKLSLSPNPAQSNLQISSELPIKSVRIYTIQGGFVKEFIATKDIDVSSLKSGIYLIEIKTDKWYFEKFIKQ